MTRDANGDQRPLIAEFDERDSISYEEFGGTQDYVNCVTCQGTGRISSSTSQQLVALIPYDDERLKPKKTAVYVTLAISGAVLACGVIAGLLVYFMMPRPVEINMVGFERSGADFNPETKSLEMTFRIPLLTKNPNFSSANLTSTDGTLSFMTSQVGKIKDKQFHILPSRSMQTWQNITTSIIFDQSNHLTWIYEWCQNESARILSLNIHINVNVTVRGTVQQTAIQQLCYVSCDPQKPDSQSNCNPSPF